MTTQYDKVYAVAAQGHTVLEQGLYEESATQKYDLGHTLRLNDGRTFMYAKAGAVALAAGKLCQGPLTIVNDDFFDLVPTGTSSAIGSTAVTVTLSTTAATANMFKDGFLNVNDGTGEGHCYKIKSNPAADASATLSVSLYDPIRVALASATSKVYLTPSIFNGVLVHASPATAPLVGIPPIAVTAAYYFWIQTYGPVMCLRDATTMVVGGTLLASLSTDGAIALYDNDSSLNTVKLVGQLAGLAGATTEYVPIFLTIFP